jgi:AraC-like DNA-binding protein
MSWSIHDRAARISFYIDAHLDDPELSAQSCARALGISVRSLHLALAGTPFSFRELITERRLQLCRERLRAGGREESVADLAFACGFNSLSSFYRGFARRFGTCPTRMAWDAGDKLAA